MASNSLQHAKDQAVLDYVEQAVLREGEAIRSKCIAKTSKPIRVFGLKEKYANVRNWHSRDSTGSSPERPLLKVSPTFHHKSQENSGDWNWVS